MDGLFLEILNLSLYGSFAIVAVLILRFLLKKSPKSISYGLWLVVFLALILPVRIKTSYSPMPVGVESFRQEKLYQAVPQVESGISLVDDFVAERTPVRKLGEEVFPMERMVEGASVVWFAGTVILLGYGMISSWKLRKKLKNGEKLEPNVYQVEGLPTAFVMGLPPCIYLPADLTEEEREYVLCHERIHIKRHDMRMKQGAFVILCLHWFNPLVWLAFRCMEADMESSCDEKVLEKMGTDIKKGYSLSLVRLSAEERWFGTPLAFGEKPIKTRVKHILQYKKPVSVVAGLAVVAAVAVGCAIWSAPEKVDDSNDIARMEEEKIVSMVESQGSHIIDREVMQATQHACVDGLLGEGIAVEVWSGECQYQLDSDKPLQLPEGVTQEGDYLYLKSEKYAFGAMSMPEPDESGVAEFSYTEEQAALFGVCFGSLRFYEQTMPQEEMGTMVRALLEEKGYLTPETYPGNHIIVDVSLHQQKGYSDQRLLLSQPVKQGDGGIWCVERWSDELGHLYYNYVSGAEEDAYYAEQQAQCDEGHKVGLLNPEDVAMTFLRDEMGLWSVTTDDIVVREGTLEDFYGDMSSKQFGYILELDFENEWLRLNEAQWYTEENRERLAQVHLDPNMEMPNGYYIRTWENDRTMDMGKRPEILVVEFTENGVEQKELKSWKELQKHLEEEGGYLPFWITSENGVVTKVEEQYVP
ncbi:MAG: M56 family metallopeptidase [Anaerotignum lactatifermentans]|uniref:M56 family metallopeptidase n=1 Tax=Anaerotignum lactatifermentans TaxID=160404 RepID=UPI00399AF22B